MLIVNFAEKRPCVIFASKPFKDVEFLHLSYVLELLYWISSAASRPFDKIASFEVQYILGTFWLCPLPLFFFIIADFYCESVFRINIMVHFNKSDFVVLSGYSSNCCFACRTESF